MVGADFVVAIGADQEKPTDARTQKQRLEQIQSRRIPPLQVVEEYRERMRRMRQCRDEVFEHAIEAILRVGRRDGSGRRLFANDQFDFRDDFGDDSGVVLERRDELLASAIEALGAFGEQLLHKLPERLNQRVVGNVARKLIELAGDEVASLARSVSPIRG